MKEKFYEVHIGDGCFWLIELDYLNDMPHDTKRDKWFNSQRRKEHKFNQRTVRKDIGDTSYYMLRVNEVSELEAKLLAVAEHSNQTRKVKINE